MQRGDRWAYSTSYKFHHEYGNKYRNRYIELISVVYPPVYDVFFFLYIPNRRHSSIFLLGPRMMGGKIEKKNYIVKYITQITCVRYTNSLCNFRNIFSIYLLYFFFCRRNIFVLVPSNLYSTRRKIRVELWKNCVGNNIIIFRIVEAVTVRILHRILLPVPTAIPHFTSEKSIRRALPIWIKIVLSYRSRIWTDSCPTG